MGGAAIVSSIALRLGFYMTYIARKRAIRKDNNC